MISVVLSVYNTGKYLPKAMDALLAQTYTDFEILIVDDGSTDGSAAICEAQAARRPGSRVFHKESGGLSSARNCGIDHARGTYIIFPDPDDWVEPDYLEGLMAIQAQSGADLAAPLLCRALEYGNRCGWFCVQRKGAIQALPTRADIEALA